MNTEAEILRQKFSELLRWERRKRREQTVVTVGCCALLVALLTMPLHAYLPPQLDRWWMPMLFFLALAPWRLFRRRWLPQDTTRALARMDKALRLEERAITAWELLPRRDWPGAGRLVLKEAGEKLKAVDPRRLFLRRWNWQAYAFPPLLLLWVSAVWFDFGAPVNSHLNLPTPQALAHKLKEYSRELQERAKAEGLGESLRLGRELEKVAQRGIDAKTRDEQFKAQLAAAAKKIESRSGDMQSSFPGADSQQTLRDLKAELEAAKDLGNLTDGAKGTQEMTQRWLEHLAALPQLGRQLEREHPDRQDFNQNQLRSFLESMEKKVAGELDRRAVLDAQRYLEQLMKQGQGDKGDRDIRVAGRGERGAPEAGQKEQNRGNQAGTQPGSKENLSQPPRQMPGGSSTRVKGLLGEGNSSGVIFKGKPAPGKSEVAEQEVIATYRRQAEAELNTERVPDALKEMIKNYFLSLERNEVK